jgi:hypothetical protein
MERSGDDKIHAAVERIFQVRKQATWEPRRGTHYVDQEIDIAFRRRVAPSHCAENADIPCAVLGRNRLNFEFPGAKRFERIHGFILV